LLGSAIGLFAGFWLILITDLVHKFEFISYIAVGLIYATITGLTLIGLLAYKNQHQANLTNAT
ncbi:MAG: hypothetical protein ABFS03_13655, partial [Chloroflexota bacterium]